METAFPCLRATYLEFMLVFCDLDLIGTAFPCLKATCLDFMLLFFGIDFKGMRGNSFLDLRDEAFDEFLVILPALEDFMAIFLGVLII